MLYLLIAELKRRKIFKVATAYLVIAWLIVQVSTIAVTALNLPAWINSAVFLFCIIGFPIALFFAWVLAIAPEGGNKVLDVNSEETVPQQSTGKLYFIIISVLAVALSYFIYESRFAAERPDQMTSEEAVQAEGTSIAVLPFVNMSSDEEQEYFSDGITEEILNLLAKIANLQVTSRSSSFFYKETKVNISQVAKALGVNNVLEGSVRRSGNRIRITAKLIEAKTDTNIWSETYDRDLEDIFTIQDEISAAIVETLKSKLGLNATIVARDMKQISLGAHQEYLKGRFYIENRNKTDVEIALSHFEKAIEMSPKYAAAWMGKGWANLFLIESLYGDTSEIVGTELARSAIEMALKLDPNMPEAHGIMGLIEGTFFNYDKSITHFKKAIELNPNYSDALAWYSDDVAPHSKKRVELVEKAVKLNPMSILANDNYGDLLIDYGRIEEALQVANNMIDIDATHPFPYSILGRVQLTKGDYANAIINFTKAVENSPDKLEYQEDAYYNLATIGLTDQAAAYNKYSEYSELYYWHKGDINEFVKQSREVYPSDKSDLLGMYFRGDAEGRAENYSEAVKYFNQSTIGDTDIVRIYSFLQVGDTASAQRLIKILKLELANLLNAKIKYVLAQPIELMAMEIAYLEGDIDKAVISLKQAMDKHYIIDYDYKFMPMFEKLRQHRDWPAILAESERRAGLQRELYATLLAKDE